MPYTRTTWQDYPNTTTPITAASLNNVEAFLESISTVADAWTSYTPTWTNLTVGTSVQDSKYLNAGKLYVVRLKITLGSGFSISGGPEWTLPDGVSFRSDYVGTTPVGNGYMLKAGGSAFAAYVTPGAGVLNRARFAVHTVSGSNITFGGATATSPATWAANDIFTAQFMFEAA